MNAHAKPLPQTVTTGPIRGSRKIYVAPEGAPEIQVPFREIQLTDPAEASVRVYDTSGPYTEENARVDLAAGLPALREAWIAGRGYAAIQGRAVRPEDNGNVSADALVAPCPAQRTIRTGAAGQLVTQMEFARAGIVTPEMVYVAHRENLGRAAMRADAEAKIADGESFGAEIPPFIT
ncbi:MAG TPA: phosphomethylpyrimidine synthase ThiC, partial [Salinarimonas sp.]|nr:phosphomethylpyrimidine synthase ThiC [Salinarimonas sp.]